MRWHYRVPGLVIATLLAAACSGTDEDIGPFDASNEELGRPCGKVCDAGGSETGATGDAATISDANTHGDAATIADSGGDSSTSDAASGNDAGGTADSGSGIDAGTGSYSTLFSGTENPISEGSVWTNGGTVGLDWQNIRKEGGLAFATATSAGYDDCIAHLSGFGANHYAQATVHVASNYSPGSSHEVELLLRFKITANNARGYEVLAGWNGAYSQIVRWNGPINDFTYLTTTGPGFGALQDGDVIRATAIGSTLTAYKNGAQVMQATDSTWSDGNPGMGFFVRPDAAAVPTNYCYTDYQAGTL